MGGRYRVFGTNTTELDPAALLQFLAGLGGVVEGHFQGDDQGWFRLRVLRDGTPMEIERYLVGEEGIRAELNTWAAWVEATGDGPGHADLMRRLISTQQLMVLQDFPAEVGEPVARHLAELTAGVYQADGLGFFTSSGTLLLSE